MTRVLVGSFGGVTRLGLRKFLLEEGFDVVAVIKPGEDLLECVTQLRPEVVIVDLEEVSLGLAGQIAASFPTTKVIACSSDDPIMRIFPRFHRGESYPLQLTHERLVEAVSSPD